MGKEVSKIKICSKHKHPVSENQLCDYFDHKKAKYKSRCKDCIFFREKPEILHYNNNAK